MIVRGRKPGQGVFAGGRPKGTTLPAWLKREPLHEITLPKWIKQWLLSHPRQAGRIIEKALFAEHGEELSKIQDRLQACEQAVNLEQHSVRAARSEVTLAD